MPHLETSNLSLSRHSSDKGDKRITKHATLLALGRWFSNPVITTLVSVLASLSISTLLHLASSQPFPPFEMILPVIIPLLVAYPISVMFQFFTNELERSNQSLVDANEQIENQRMRLEQLNQTKLQLFSLVAHDLRSPVGVLSGFLDFMREEDTTVEDVTRLVPAMADQIQTTLQLMDNLLQWSNSQMNGLQLSPTTIDLQALLEENARLFNSPLAKKNITLSIEDFDSVKIVADRDMLLLVLRNLIANAIKFTPENGQIWIKTSSDDKDHVVVTVQDTGVGISAKNLKKLFRSNQPLTTPGTSNEKGTGLGLLLCKQFIEKHNGNIWVESEIGKGSKFCFTLPKTIPEHVPAAA